MFAEGFVVHEEVAEVPVAVDVVDPSGELFSGEWPFFPGFVGESEGDVVGEFVVFEEEAEGGRGRGSKTPSVGLADTSPVRTGEEGWIEGGGWGAIDIRRGAVAQVRVGAFADGAEEPWVAVFVFDFREGAGQGVGVDEFGISEDSWGLAEVLLDEVGVHVELVAELVLGIEETQRVVVGLGDELDAAGVCELLEEVEDIGGELFPLLDDGACDGVGDAEVALVAFDELEHELGRRAVALVGDLLGDLAVGFFVEVEGVGVKDGVGLQAVWLVDLEVEDDRGHGIAPVI